MSAPADHVPRLLECGNAMKLAACSPLAMRVYLHLFWGEDSEKPGFGRCSIGLLKEKLSSSPRSVRAALDELTSAGLIVWSETERLAYRPGFAATLRPSQPAVLVNWHDTAARLPDGLIATQVRKDIGPRPDLNSKCKRESNSGYSSVSSVSTIPSVDLPADAGAPDEPAQASLTLESPPVRAKKNPPAGLLIVQLWNEYMVTETHNVKARMQPENARLLNALATKHSEEELRSLFQAARSNDFYAGRSHGARSLWNIIGAENWEKFRKDVGNQRPQQPAQQQRLSYDEQADILKRHYNEDED